MSWLEVMGAIAAQSAQVADPYTVHLLNCNGTDASTNFVDSALSGNAPHTVTANGDAQLDTAVKKYGSASGLFDGAGDYLSVPDSVDWTFGTGDFTLENWVRMSSIGSGDDSYFISAGNRTGSNTLYRLFAINFGGVDLRLDFRSDVGGTTDAVLLQDAATMVIDTWYHVAVARSGNTWRLFKDGTQVDSTTNAGSMPDPAVGLHMAAASLSPATTAFQLTGWLDDIRVSKGVARYTSNFTPPGELTPYAA